MRKLSSLHGLCMRYGLRKTVLAFPLILNLDLLLHIFDILTKCKSRAHLGARELLEDIIRAAMKPRDIDDIDDLLRTCTLLGDLPRSHFEVWKEKLNIFSQLKIKGINFRFHFHEMILLPGPYRQESPDPQVQALLEKTPENPVTIDPPSQKTLNLGFGIASIIFSVEDLHCKPEAENLMKNHTRQEHELAIWFTELFKNQENGLICFHIHMTVHPSDITR